jgi:hypothetical protein
VTTAIEPVLYGKQMPRVHSVPPAPVSLGDRAIAFAAECGLFLDPWQQLVLRDSLGVQPGGMWASPRVGLLCPRQNGKGSILEALELFHMFVLRTPLIVHSAHKFDTSQEHFIRLRTLIEANPDLHRHVKSMPTSQGHEAIILRNGNRLKFKARTVGGAGRGFSADLLVLDEAMLLPEQALDAMLPTLAARKNPQVWFTSSAGMPESDALWRIVKRGREGSPRLAYFEWGCESGADPLDRQNWADANPGLGYRLSLDYLDDELNDLSPDGFAREHLGIWDDAASTAAIDVNQWMELADPAEGGCGPNPSFAVATAPDRSWSAVAVAWRRPDGLPYVELVDYRRDATWVADVVTELRSQWGSPVLVDQASRGLLPDAVKVSQEDRAKADNTLSDAVLAGRLRHGGEAAMKTAVGAAQWRTYNETRIFDRKGSAEISPLVAASLAVWSLVQSPDYDLLDSLR